jgi:hypothetical protein
MNKKYLAAFIVAVIIIGAGAFYGGTAFEKNKLSKQGLLRNQVIGANGSNRIGQGGPGNGQFGNRQGGFNRGQNGGGFIGGQIVSKDDKSLTVKGQDGSSKIVFFSDQTTVGKSAAGAIGDLNIGQDVMVNGQANPDGSLNAQNIQIRPDQPQRQ